MLHGFDMRGFDERHAGGVMTAWDVTVSLLSKANLLSPPTDALDYIHTVNIRLALLKKWQRCFSGKVSLVFTLCM